MADTIQVRLYEDQDLGQVLGVLRDSLGESPLLKRTPELFSWKHIRNPFGRSIILVATAGDRIAGVRAFMRWDLTTADGDMIRCGRAVDTATHPDFQRQGIFSTLTKAAVDAARDDGVHLIFNTPNPDSGAGYLKMGWTEVGRIGIQLRPSLRMVKGNADPESLPNPTEWLQIVTPATDLPLHRRPATGLRTVRDGGYLAWRFQQHPTAKYFKVGTDEGAAVVRPNVRNNRRELVVSDLVGRDLVGAARAAARASRADYLAGWFSPGSPERSAAIRAGMLPVPRVSALTLVCRPLVGDLPFNACDLSSWDLAMSDLELL